MAIRYPRTMRMLAFLFAVQAVACAGPSSTVSGSDQPEIPLHYCLSAPGPREAFLASNPDALAADVVARRVVVLNQDGWREVRVARASSTEQCSGGEQPFSAQDLQARLNQTRVDPEVPERCAISLPQSEDPPYTRHLLQFSGLSGLRMLSVTYGGSVPTVVTSQDDCALAEPLIRAIESRVRAN